MNNFLQSCSYFIMQHEIGSQEQYNRMYLHPCWPSEQSGITIGIGYDLQFVSKSQFKSDWGGLISDNDISMLEKFCGSVGSKNAVEQLRKTYQPFNAAWDVFCKKTIPEYINKTEKAFPGYGSLPPLCQSALVSLVYNRGPSMIGERRKEMKYIHDLIIVGDLESVPEQFRSMKRLWPTLAGLRKRRDGEAELWERGLKET